MTAAALNPDSVACDEGALAIEVELALRATGTNGWRQFIFFEAYELAPISHLCHRSV
jgi:hypothetical protein